MDEHWVQIKDESWEQMDDEWIQIMNDHWVQIKDEHWVLVKTLFCLSSALCIASNQQLWSFQDVALTKLRQLR